MKFTKQTCAKIKFVYDTSHYNII